MATVDARQRETSTSDVEKFADDFVLLWATLANDPGKPRFVNSWRWSEDNDERHARARAQWEKAQDELGNPGPWDYHTSAERWPWPLSTERFGPRPFQTEAFERCYHDGQILDHGMSAGKTTTILATLEALEATRVLVIAPRWLLAVWTDEIAENANRQWVVWAGKVASKNGGHLKNPNVPRRCEALIQANTDAIKMRRPFAAIVNYEALDSKAMRELALGTHWDAVVCDESHVLANANGVRTKIIKNVTARCRGRGGRILEGTGTFLPHSPLSCFGQMLVLNPDVLGQYVTHFRARYASYKVIRQQNACPICYRTFDRPAGSGCPVLCNDPATGRIALLQEGEPVYMAMAPKQDGSRIAKDYKIPGKQDDRIPEGVRPDREAELMQRLSPWVHRVSQDEVDELVGLVGAVPQLRTIALDPETRKMYDALERGLITQYEAGTITSANAMTNFGTLLRVCNGHGRDAATQEMVGFGLDRDGLCAKARGLLIPALEETDPDEPIVVFANWVFDFPQIERACRKLGRRYGELSGRRSDGLDGKYMAANIDVLACQWDSGSVGLNFTRARHEIDYSLSTKGVPNLQGPRRLNRVGQTKAVTRRILAIEDSVEVNWFYALKRRTSQNDAVLARLRRTNA